MSLDYVCTKCGATDSTRCDFRISTQGRVVPSQKAAARDAGCRVQHYSDNYDRTGTYHDKEKS